MQNQERPDGEGGGSTSEAKTVMAPSRFTIRVAHLSDRGLRRPNNEDSLLVLRLIRDSGDRTVDGRLLAVADGMGGMERGEIASRLTLTSLAAFVCDRFGEVPEGDIPGQVEFLQGAFSAANERVYDAQDPRAESKMGSTLVVACTVGRSLFIAHAGDSRCYLLRNRGIERATRDDSVVQGLIDAGKITEAEAAVHPQRSRINNAIGLYPPSRFRSTVRHVGEVRDFEYILLCSDGLHGVVTDDAIAAAVYENRDAAAAADALLERAMEGGAPDNITLVLARVVAGETDHTRIDFGAIWRRVRRSGNRVSGS